MIPLTGQKHAHSDTNNVDGERKGEELIHQRSMGVCIHVVTGKT